MTPVSRLMSGEKKNPAGLIDAELDVSHNFLAWQHRRPKNSVTNSASGQMGNTVSICPSVPEF